MQVVGGAWKEDLAKELITCDIERQEFISLFSLIAHPIFA